MKKSTLIVVLATLASTGFTVHAQSVNQVRSWAAACANCHGTHGQAQTGMEKLAGLAKDDIVKKMLDFKHGRKPATVMHQIAKGYEDSQIEALAAWFAAQK